MNDQHVALVRAYKGQPLKRVVVDEDPDIYFVANPRSIDAVREGRSWPVGFRHSECYAWNADAFERLAKLYALQGHTALDAWIDLPLFTGTPLMSSSSKVR